MIVPVFVAHRSLCFFFSDFIIFITIMEHYQPVWKPEPIDHHESGLITTNHHYKWYLMIIHQY